jgi:hypothetical protein
MIKMKHYYSSESYFRWNILSREEQRQRHTLSTIETLMNQAKETHEKLSAKCRSLEERQQSILSKLDKLLQNLMDYSQPVLSNQEIEYHQELQKMSKFIKSNYQIRIQKLLDSLKTNMKPDNKFNLNVSHSLKRHDLGQDHWNIELGLSQQSSIGTLLKEVTEHLEILLKRVELCKESLE